MLNLTRQERQVILFLICVSLSGLGISYLTKVNARVKRIMRQDDRLGKLDINKASYEDLLNARVVTPGLAKKIIECRLARGGFFDMEELKEIKGVGERRFERLKEVFFVQ